MATGPTTVYTLSPSGGVFANPPHNLPSGSEVETYVLFTATSDYSARNYTPDGVTLYCLREDVATGTFEVFTYTNPMSGPITGQVGLPILYKKLSKCFFVSPQYDPTSGQNFYFYYPITGMDESAKTITVSSSPALLSPGSTNPHIFRLYIGNPDLTDPMPVFPDYVMA
jgi:hypothetical protein